MQRTVILAVTLASLLAAPALAKSSQTAAGMQTMPRCAAGDHVVWLNTKSNTYHLSGDRYYGKTKSGKYECESQAKASGAKMAKSNNVKNAGAPGAEKNTMSSGRHGKHHGTAPEEAASPAAR